MKIKRSELPESIAKALASRTFAQERPEDGQYIEANVGGGFERCRLEHRNDYLDCLRFDNGRHYTVLDKWSWKPILEIEDEAPEPQRAPPEPGSYFIVDERIAYIDGDGEQWRYHCDKNGEPAVATYMDVWELLPDNWQPLPDLIAKAARAGELEVELAKASRLQADWKATCERERAKNTGLFCELNKLEAKIKQQDAELERSRSTVRDRSITNEALTQIIEEQNFLLDKIDSAFNYTDMHTARRMLDERKAREASE